MLLKVFNEKEGYEGCRKKRKMTSIIHIKYFKFKSKFLKMLEKTRGDALSNNIAPADSLRSSLADAASA